MSLPLVLHPEAQAEFDESHDWYEAREEGLGERFDDAVNATLALIEQSPRRFRIVRGDLRQAVVPVFPFRIFYAVEEDRIYVTSVFHTSRDPAVWQGRQ